MTAIAAVLIGGTSIFGGRAIIVGTVFGAFIMGMIEAGLVASGLTGAWVRTVQGLIFLIAIIFYLPSTSRIGGPLSWRASGRGRARRPKSPAKAGKPPGPNRPAPSKGGNTMSIRVSLLAGAAGLILAAAAPALARTRRPARA